MHMGDQQERQQNELQCFICRCKKKSEKLRSTKEGTEKLAKQLLNFNKIDGSANFVSEICKNEDEESLKVKLLSKKYHKSCYDKYNNKRLREVTSRKRRLELENDEAGPSKKRTTRNSDQYKRQLGDAYCIFCNKSDNVGNLRAAGAFHSTTATPNVEHIKQLTNEWATMAAFLEDNTLLAKFSTGDVTSNEFFYHTNCYVGFRNRYFSKKIGRK